MVKNHLKSVKDITAPLNWRSSPDSPETQLAYVTQDEIDMMVDANIHGSMDGKPNVGPKGIISLDGGGSSYQAGKTTYSTKAQSPPGTGGTGGGGGGGQSGYQPSAWAKKKMKENKAKIAKQKEKEEKEKKSKWKTKEELQEINQEKIDKMNKEKAALAEADKKETLAETLTKIKNTIMRKGDWESDPFSTTKKSWETAGKKLPGEHKLRTQYNRLMAKYGPGWGKTTQAKELLGYLAGVPTEKGGFLGGRDPEYGGGNVVNPEMEANRRALLEEWPSQYHEAGIQDKLSELWRGITQEDWGADLTEDQWFNFRQQLMASDPSYGNLDYKKALPWSSGAAIPAIGKALASPFSMPATGIMKALSGDKKKERRPKYTGEALDPALLRALKERGEILDPFAREEGGQELAFDTRYGGGGEPPPDDEDTTPPGDDQGWMTADAGKIGWMDEYGDYHWGPYTDYKDYAQVNPILSKDGGIVGLYNGGYLNNSNGVIGLDGGGYLDDYKAADSLMFKDPQEDEEWEYNV